MNVEQRESDNIHDGCLKF